MRRNDREVTDINQIKGILDSCKITHVAMVDDGYPYVLPLSYAYELEGDSLNLYFHCAQKGRKIDILHKNNNVCFEMCIEGIPVNAAKTPCNSGYYFSSVHGFGKVEFIEDIDEKCRLLSLFLKHQTNLNKEFTPAQANSVCMFKIKADSFTAKVKPAPAS